MPKIRKENEGHQELVASEYLSSKNYTYLLTGSPDNTFQILFSCHYWIRNLVKDNKVIPDPIDDRKFQE
jgi:hypothetical protein